MFLRFVGAQHKWLGAGLASPRGGAEPEPEPEPEPELKMRRRQRARSEPGPKPGAQPEPEPEPKPEPPLSQPASQADVRAQPRTSPAAHYRECYELSYVYVDKQCSPFDRVERQLVWLPDRDAPCDSTVLVMLIYPTWQPNNLLDDRLAAIDALAYMALGSPFANPREIPIRPRPRSPAAQDPQQLQQPTALAATSEGPEPEPVRAKPGPLAARRVPADDGFEQRNATLLVPEDEQDGDEASRLDDEDDHVFQTPHASRDAPDEDSQSAPPDTPADAETASRGSRRRLRRSMSMNDASKPGGGPRTSGSARELMALRKTPALAAPAQTPLPPSPGSVYLPPTSPDPELSSTVSTASTASSGLVDMLRSRSIPQSMPRRVKAHFYDNVEKFAERKGFVRQIPFDGVVVLEVDWSTLTGFEYYNALSAEGRMCMETNRVHKRCFASVDLAVQHYKISPTDECATRCGLGQERDALSELYNQPEKTGGFSELTPEKLQERRAWRAGPEGGRWRCIPWPSWQDGSAAQRSASGESDLVGDLPCSDLGWQRSVSGQSSASCCGATPETNHSSADSTCSSSSSSSKSRGGPTALGLDSQQATEPVLLYAQMLAIYFTCPFLPGAAGRLMLRAEQAKLLRDYEAGLPGWAVLLATNPFVPNLPIIGVWYRPRMRSLLTAVIIIVQVVSMICGFYDLWRNIPFIQPTLVLVWTPVYNWVIGPVATAFSSVFSSIFSAFITSGLSNLFAGISHVFSFVLAPVISATFMAFQPLVALFSPLLLLTNNVLRTLRTCVSVVLSGPRQAAIAFGQLMALLSTLLKPILTIIATLVAEFGGFVSGCVAFPFHMVFSLLRPLVGLFQLVVRSISVLVQPLRSLAGMAPSTATVVNTATTFGQLQRLWVQVLRPIKAVVKSGERTRATQHTSISQCCFCPPFQLCCSRGVRLTVLLR